MHVAFAGILTWLCPQDIKNLNHLFIFLITQITSVDWFLRSVPTCSISLSTLTAQRKKTIFDLVIEEVYLTKSELLINYLHEHSTSADSIHEDFLLFTKNKLTRLWSVWYLELANVELRMMIRYKTSRITLWNAIVTALMYWVCQVESVTSFCCCSFLKFCRERVTAEATEKFSCPFFF